MQGFSPYRGSEKVGAVKLPFQRWAKEIIKVMVEIIQNMKKGYPAGNDLVKEILSLKVVSKYKMAKDLGVNRQTVYNWLYDHSHPDEKNYMRIKDYRLYVNKLLMIGVFR